jgi:hypothetical protein
MKDVSKQVLGFNWSFDDECIKIEDDQMEAMLPCFQFLDGSLLMVNGANISPLTKFEIYQGNVVCLSLDLTQLYKCENGCPLETILNWLSDNTTSDVYRFKYVYKINQTGSSTNSITFELYGTMTTAEAMIDRISVINVMVVNSSKVVCTVTTFENGKCDISSDTTNNTPHFKNQLH